MSDPRKNFKCRECGCILNDKQLQWGKQSKCPNCREKIINKICPKCGCPLIIDEWDGWKWVCWKCEKEYGIATDEEISAFDKEMNKFEKRIQML